MLPEPLGWGVSLDPLEWGRGHDAWFTGEGKFSQTSLGPQPSQKLRGGARSSLPTPSYFLKVAKGQAECPEPGHGVSTKVEVWAPSSGLGLAVTPPSVSHF